MEAIKHNQHAEQRSLPNRHTALGSQDGSSLSVLTCLLTHLPSRKSAFNSSGERPQSDDSHTRSRAKG